MVYTQNYFKILEDMLESFYNELGTDSQKKETPFSKFWKAVHKDESQKNPFATKLVLRLALLQPNNEPQWSQTKVLLGDQNPNPECKQFIKQLLSKFETKHQALTKLQP